MNERVTAKHAQQQGRGGNWLISHAWGYVAAIALLPYAALKTIWAFGGTIGLSSQEAVAQIAGHSQALKEQSAILYDLHSYGIDLTAVLAVVASLFSLCFALPWRKRIPRYLLIIPGWFIGMCTIIAISLGIIQTIGLLPKGTTEGMQLWVFIITYGGFLCWGGSLFLAALAFQKETHKRQL